MTKILLIQSKTVTAECDSKTSKSLNCIDCNKFEKCVGDNSTILTCPSSQRYCTTGIANDFCSSALQPGNTACNFVTKNFECTRPGYFPSKCFWIQIKILYLSNKIVLSNQVHTIVQNILNVSFLTLEEMTSNWYFLRKRVVSSNTTIQSKKYVLRKHQYNVTVLVAVQPI